MAEMLSFLHGRHAPRCIASVDKPFDYHTLQFMAAGAVELFYDDARHDLRGPWLWTCFPGPRIRFHESPRGRAWDHRYIAFTGPRVAEWEAQGLWSRQPQEVTAHDAGRVAAMFDELLAETERPGRWARLRAANLLERILLDAAQRREAHPPERPTWLAEVTQRLAELGGNEPDYAALAKAHGMSLSTLRRRFGEATGTSLHQYRLDARLAAARELLGDTNVPLKEIASRIGYTDVFYFSRHFRQRVGVAPAAYRRSRQGGAA